MLDVEIIMRGPVLDGSAPVQVDEWLEQAKDDVAARAYAQVMTNLDQSIKRPTPYYETQIIIQTLQTDRVVHDRGIVYGPWLEGVSSRNRTTRFKGYASFRRAKQDVGNQVPALLRPSLRNLLERLS
jgi:hypothetical protein